uniref:GAF domain-containing protein n=1 Tax=Candidatus Kentrum sp. TUN TaxID=2126343 RepID=A0A450ZGU3_9GAMM|nr:MAG: GAF domain-containing protein [Candidatus Kentron sp. TUN]VFK53777.1 MAG: GAF domain-containing protein [Candidatus Kentron sp. TUN]VFK56514.1 MAG: GAF domain-containing protein [Candidatus Kentron sp. TUN]
MSDSEHSYTQEAVSLVGGNHNLERENRTLRVFISALRDLTEAVEESGEPDVIKLLDSLLESALHMTNTKDGSLLAMDDDANELVFAAVRGEVEVPLGWRRIPSGKGIVGWVVQNRRSTIVNDPREDERFYDDLDVMFKFRTNSILAAPLIGGGKMLGVVEVVNGQDGQLFSTGDQELLTLFCRLAGELLYSTFRKTRDEG